MCVYIGGGGAMSLVEKWWCEHMKKLVEREAFIASIRIQSAQLKSKFFG